MRLMLVLMCILMCVFSVSFAQLQPDPGSDTQRTAGKALYDQKCSQCHGIDGDGNGIAKMYFWPTPRDFSLGRLKIRTTPSGELPTHEDITNIIRRGMPYSGMPAWPDLSNDQLDNLAYHIKSFSEYFNDPDFLVPPIEIPKAPAFSAASAELGKVLYEENKCGDCHGVDGRGDGKSSATLSNEWDEAIKPADLTKRWTFRGGATREDIYRTFTTGLNGTPMPSYAELVDPEQRWQLVDYVYAFSRDEPEYSTVLVAEGVEGLINIDGGTSAFDRAPAAFFPLFGQIVEPGRAFYPTADAVEVRAVYNETDIAIMVQWHDMTDNTTGSNGPAMPVPLFDANEAVAASVVDTYSDAVAVQFPSANMTGSAKPYFLFGDTKNPVDLWYRDAAAAQGELLAGRGGSSVLPLENSIASATFYENGRWTVIFKHPRYSDIDGALSFDPATFIPVAFSVWDGYRAERGSKRSVSGWYSLYLKPLEEESKLPTVAGYGIVTLFIELILVAGVRLKYRNSGSAS